MKSLLRYLHIISAALLLSACDSERAADTTLSSPAPIVPDYAGVTVPPNIAPLHFALADSCEAKGVQAVFSCADKRFVVSADGDGVVAISAKKWRELTGACTDSITVSVRADIKGRRVEFAPFGIRVAREPIEPYIAYRLIEPGYETWNEMGIYQRCLENFTEEPIITNRQTNYGCMNCHSFCNRDPHKMLFHLRVDYGGTYMVDGDHIEKLNTKTPETISALVYPSWHPSGDFVAFSVNDTKQLFHTTSTNRIEVLDFASDVVVYDVNRHEIITAPQLSSAAAFETFPTFSPDGKTLYFCSADTVAMPQGYDRVKYSLCSVAFDPSTRKFGSEVDTLYNSHTQGRSVSFPRVSPDGRRLMFTLADYGNFSIWHRDADIYMADLDSKEIAPLDAINSPETESYHAWSGDSRWVVFSSRRDDGLYTRLYIAYIDEQGRASKPFLLPQKSPRYYTMLQKSYNVPEFISGKVEASGHDLSSVARTSPGTDLHTAH